MPATLRLSAFVDSSALFAAVVSRQGSARDLVVAAFDDKVDLVLSDDVLIEVERNLAKKRSRAIPVLNSFLQSGVFRVENPPSSLVEGVARVVVPKDAAIVAGAVFARTPFLVTYDRKHLLSQAGMIWRHFGIRVAVPDEFLGRLGPP